MICDCERRQNQNARARDTVIPFLFTYVLAQEQRNVFCQTHILSNCLITTSTQVIDTITHKIRNGIKNGTLNHHSSCWCLLGYFCEALIVLWDVKKASHILQRKAIKAYLNFLIWQQNSYKFKSNQLVWRYLYTIFILLLDDANTDRKSVV